ncbi:hypothetical protein CN13_04480 [Petrotoga sp. HKA.pet.4.5]|uniref:hypothetical protein n=1 Tax=unclassified Petrotoga TaxID=2620614 RepID=UPI000EF1390F|nr:MULTISPECIES: hypothetical protein [unclassified Petrotoga]RLL82125.1 hypothetical protein BZ25_09765 [Petrotoga sp. Shatin.DS.tank11.9.2.9.3]RLL89688.1 hypothetical protein CN13_04480 [Petrotoga sp. HKA.pet.4.5]
MKKFYYVGLISILLFALIGCLPKTNERVLFKPINPSSLGESSIISYTIKEEITTTQSETFTQRLNDDFMNNNILVKYFELKDLVSGLESIPENSNLWIVVNWYDYYEALQEGLIDYNKFIKPDGYNIYRSFDGIHYTKIGDAGYGYFLDSSTENAPNKEVWYAVSSYTENGESTLVELGSVVPLETFNIELISPTDEEKNVSRQPTFAWEPTKELTSPESEVEYHYTMWIYDLVQSENYILPGILEGEDVILYDFMMQGAEEVSVTFLGSKGSSEYDDLSWFLYLPDGIYYYEDDKLEPAKTYDWGIEYTYAVAYDIDSVSVSVAVDNGYNVNPKGDIMPEKQNEFTTASN